jgi:hypothetical protein
MAAPVQRTETSPPVTLMLSSCGVGGAGVGVVWGAEGIGGNAVAGGVEGGRGVAVPGCAEGLGVAGGFDGVADIGGPSVGVIIGAGGVVLALTSVMSRPARSMATHAVAETPATAASQIVAIPPAERRLITMSPLCHLRDDKPPKPATSHGVACSCGNYLVDRGRQQHQVCDHPGPY